MFRLAVGGVKTAGMVASLIPLNTGLATTAASAWAATAPFLAIAAAIGAVTLAIVELNKHWKELNFLEGLKGIKESFAPTITGTGEKTGAARVGRYASRYLRSDRRLPTAFKAWKTDVGELLPGATGVSA